MKKLLATLLTFAFAVSSYAGSTTNNIVIYSGLQTANVVTDQTGDPQNKTGKRVNTVYFILDVVNRNSRTLVLKKSAGNKTFNEEPLQVHQAYRSEDGRPAPKEYVVLASTQSNASDPQLTAASFYKGVASHTTSTAAHLAYDFPRVFSLTGNFAISSTGVTTLVNARATLNMSVPLSKASNDAHEFLDLAVQRVKDLLIAKGYTEVPSF